MFIALAPSLAEPTAAQLLTRIRQLYHQLQRLPQDHIRNTPNSRRSPEYHRLEAAIFAASTTYRALTEKGPI
jgi:hypothetical protein